MHNPLLFFLVHGFFLYLFRFIIDAASLLSPFMFFDPILVRTSSWKMFFLCKTRARTVTEILTGLKLQWLFSIKVLKWIRCLIELLLTFQFNWFKQEITYWTESTIPLCVDTYLHQNTFVDISRYIDCISTICIF